MLKQAPSEELPEVMPSEALPDQAAPRSCQSRRQSEELAEKDALATNAVGGQLLGELHGCPAGQAGHEHGAVAGVPAHRTHQALGPLKDCAPNGLLHLAWRGLNVQPNSFYQGETVHMNTWMSCSNTAAQHSWPCPIFIVLNIVWQGRT